MDKVGKYLMKVMADKGLAGAAVSSQVCFYAQEYGKGSFEVISYSRGVLKLSCRDSIDAGEVQMMSGEIITHVNDKMGRKLVKRLQLVNTG